MSDEYEAHIVKAFEYVESPQRSGWEMVEACPHPEGCDGHRTTWHFPTDRGEVVAVCEHPEECPFTGDGRTDER